MEFRVIDRKSLDVPAWEKLTAESSFFHSHYWVDTCVDGLSPGTHAEFLCGYEGDLLIAGMPAVITRDFGFKSFYSMPYGTYGEVVMADGVNGSTRDEFYLHLVKYLKKRRFSRIAITDFDRNFSGMSEPFLDHSETFTHIIYLDDNEEHTPPDRKINGHIRAGQKADTEIICIKTREQLNAFYRLYEMTEKRHGSIKPLYSKHFFNSILKHLSNTEMLYWNCLMFGDRMVGSCINFIYAGTLFNWQTVSDYEYRRFKPNHILLSEAIDVGISMGIRKINLGASPSYAHSLIDYKERWGGVRVGYDTYLSDSWLRRLFSSR
ncbi:MAG: GNAT family N-acetyltransferase [Candidatus Krumholzibacteriota bacterium]|nr:GNAT family N-acetyltransferase [Candidatus Krumholzibacteriota bacterium]